MQGNTLSTTDMAVSETNMAPVLKNLVLKQGRWQYDKQLEFRLGRAVPEVTQGTRQHRKGPQWISGKRMSHDDSGTVKMFASLQLQGASMEKVYATYFMWALEKRLNLDGWTEYEKS